MAGYELNSDADWASAAETTESVGQCQEGTPYADLHFVYRDGSPVLRCVGMPEQLKQHALPIV